jgi:uncharacterized protein (DUF3084 family)
MDFDQLYANLDIEIDFIEKGLANQNTIPEALNPAQTTVANRLAQQITAFEQQIAKKQSEVKDLEEKKNKLMAQKAQIEAAKG